MSSSPDNLFQPLATDVTITDDKLIVELSDGCEITAPISWYPRLENATETELKRWEFIAKGHGIHWKAIDEDISVSALLAGRPSNESEESFRGWLSSRDA